MNEKALALLGFTEIRSRLQEYTTCELSGKMAESLLPETMFEEISRLLSETEDAVVFILRRGSLPLAGVSDISGAVRHAGAGGILSPAELLRIAGLLCACRRLQQYSQSVESGGEENRIAGYISQLIANRYLEESINRSILSETEIADEASPALWDIRRKIQHAQNTIKDRLNEMIRSSRYAKALQDAVVTVRGERYCVPVKVEYRAEIPGIVHDTSSSGQTLFVEPSFAVEGNNKIRELKVAEQEEIERILAALSAQIETFESELLQDLRLVSYLDFTFAKARLSLEMKGVRPVVREDGEIHIIEGRNPLIDRHKVVPVTIRIGQTETGKPKTAAVVITGPNTGGKTVTLKTVGLLTLMMQSGLMVPAKEKSVLSVYTNIHADIGDEQSISQNLSTFSAHMKNITEILRNCDHRSLVLFDELGAGTDPTEGAALAMSILECVYQMGATVLATTHYSELKIFASTTPGFVNASCEFDVETLRPTYKLLIGVPGKSNAFAISERLGLDPIVISRAREFLTNEDLRFEDMLTGIERNRIQIEAERQEAERFRTEAQQIFEEMENERDALRQERDAILDKTREQARDITNKARIAADRMLTELRKASIQNSREAVRDAEKVKVEFEQEAEEGESRIVSGYSTAIEKAVPPESLAEGESVRILSLGCDAVVLKAPDTDGKVYLQAGMMKLYLPLSDLKRLSKEKQQTGQSGRNPSAKGGSHFGAGALMKAANIRHELDVRGMTVDEAVFVLDRQIQDGILAKQSSFTIIHGKGTGTLRKGIHEYLRRNRYVKEFRLGVFGEGDAGVTVVTLR